MPDSTPPRKLTIAPPRSEPGDSLCNGHKQSVVLAGIIIEPQIAPFHVSRSLMELRKAGSVSVNPICFNTPNALLETNKPTYFQTKEYRLPVREGLHVI